MFRFLAWRSLVAVACAIALVAWLGMPYFDGMLGSWARVYAERRAATLARHDGAALEEAVRRDDRALIGRILARLATDNRLPGALLCAQRDRTLGMSPDLTVPVGCANVADFRGATSSRVLEDTDGSLLVTGVDVPVAGRAPLRMLIVQRLLRAGPEGLRSFVFAFIALATVTLALLLGLLSWWLLRHWMSVLVRDIRTGSFRDDASSPHFSLPILTQVRAAMREAEASQRLEIDYRENWTPQALRQVASEHLHGEQIIVVSNREPYAHVRAADGTVQVQLPASGMVTALEPVMRACSGTWIAHGSGNADREAVDRDDHVRVPPDDPVYTLRRVWLSEAEEQGYYYGFANEGLWPLCHLAYVRPAFRATDWRTYCEVNERFAAVVAAESRSRKPLVLIQDFHFAVLPQLVRARVPGATIALFWHVPWPNPETFGVCPWKAELLTQLLGADIIGFHTRYDCQNFLATCDRFIECQINHEHMTVTLRGHVCHVAPYPISIEWPPRWLAHASPVREARAAVRRAHGLAEDIHLGLGVERWDFTKGIVERFQALELYFEQHPEQIGRMSFLQVAAPSRSSLPAYQELQRRTLEEAGRINGRFATATWRPIVLLVEHQKPEQVFELYRAADFCVVNSLHDGMNLVSKEFVAARDDEDGVLILSSFAGASRELVEALVVNPFDVAETAAAIARAVAMPAAERSERMRLMRRTVQENNVYRWAGRLLWDAARIRQRQSLRIGVRTTS